jgi:hypothetical protein
MMFAVRAATASPIACLVLAAVVHALHTAFGAPGVEGVEQLLIGMGGQR